MRVSGRRGFKWEPQGRRRQVCLGATAAKALLGSKFKVTQRGELIESKLAAHVTATIHPSAILRLRPDADRGHELERFVADLQVAQAALKGL